MAEKKEKIIKEAKEGIEEILSTKALKEIMEYRWSAKLEENSRLDNAMTKGLEKGLKKGLQQGMKQGAKKEQEKIAKEMLMQKIDIETIIKCTKLSKQDIEKLINKEDKE